jgi:hypothetical protein
MKTQAQRFTPLLELEQSLDRLGPEVSSQLVIKLAQQMAHNYWVSGQSYCKQLSLLWRGRSYLVIVKLDPDPHHCDQIILRPQVLGDSSGPKTKLK